MACHYLVIDQKLSILAHNPAKIQACLSQTGLLVFIWQTKAPKQLHKSSEAVWDWNLNMGTRTKFFNSKLKSVSQREKKQQQKNVTWYP